MPIGTGYDDRLWQTRESPLVNRDGNKGLVELVTFLMTRSPSCSVI